MAAALSSSWPGIGLNSTWGRPEARDSVQLIPPGLVTSTCEAAIRSLTRSVNERKIAERPRDDALEVATTQTSAHHANYGQVVIPIRRQVQDVGAHSGHVSGFFERGIYWNPCRVNALFGHPGPRDRRGRRVVGDYVYVQVVRDPHGVWNVICQHDAGKGVRV